MLFTALNFGVDNNVDNNVGNKSNQDSPFKS